MKKSLPTSTFKRSLKMLKMGSSILKDELIGKVKAQDPAESLLQRIKQTKEFTKTLNELKGSALKVGQILALEAKDYFPQEILDILNELQNKVTPIDDEIMINVLKRELRGDFNKLTSNFQSIAAASIGQVYKAKYQNKDIVLKVQYPDISNSIDSDIKLLKLLIQSSLKISGKSLPLDPILDEIRTVLENEINYEKEAEYQELYYSFLNSSTLNFKSPKLIKELSTEKVLASEFIEGMTITEWLKTNPKDIEKEKIAKNLIELFCFEFFEWGLLQSDPNLGNYLITNDQKLVILDFGACVQYSKEFRDNYKRLINAMLGDKEQVIKISEEFELLDPRESEKTKDQFYHLMQISLYPIIEDKPFDFTTNDYSKSLRESGMEYMKKVKFAPAPKEFLFLNRRLGGLFQTLRILEVKINLRPFIEKWYFTNNS